MISPQCPYGPYNQSGVPLELSPHTHSVIHYHLFPNVEPKGNAPVTSPDEYEVSTPHTIEGEDFPFPHKGFPYSRGIPTIFSPNYVSLAQLVLGTLSASSLYHNPV